MKNKNIISVILFIPIFILVISCEQKEVEWKGTIEEEDEEGYQVVKRYKVTWKYQ